jgi:hypothetical protein
LADADSYDIPVDASVVEQVLLDRDTPLFIVGPHFDLAHPELDVQIGNTLIEDISFELWLNEIVPNIFWV